MSTKPSTDRESALATMYAALQTIAIVDPDEQDMRELQKFVRGVLDRVKDAALAEEPDNE